MEIRKLPIGIQSFEKIREGGYLYVDKTEYIWNLVNTGETYFLSRPRRFGKSLLTSTIAAYFQGKKELFRGLDIEKHENEKGKDAWQSYPVIYFNLVSGDSSNKVESGLEDNLKTTIRSYEIQYDVKTMGKTLPVQFKYLIRRIHERTGKKVVVLVDEYDKPLLDSMDVNPEEDEKNRKLYSDFFSVLKEEDANLKFVFITGVTKFSKVSIFSGLNQLEDISLTKDYACLCGITEQEMVDNLRPEIEKLANETNMTEQECLHKLAEMYDGYHFSEKSEGVYNPFSLLNALKHRKFGYYWYSTGTPTFLIRNLERSNYTVENLTDGVDVDASELTDYHVDNENPVPLFYQSGYLTIKDYDSEFLIYSLCFPNEEVKYGFLKSLIPNVLGNRDAKNPTSLRKMVLDLRSGDISSFINRVESLFAGIPYIEGNYHPYEQEWRNELYLILALMGQNTKCEVHTAKGRADCIVENEKYVYIFEFKLDQSADMALKQIDEKGYATPYKSEEKTIYEIGVNFSSEDRNIDEWKLKQVQIAEKNN